MGLTIATLTDCHLEDIESSKYQPVFASAEKVLVKPIFFVDEKKQPHRFTGICRFASNEIWRVNLRVQLFVVVWINSSCTQGFPFGKYTVEQISAHICDRGGGLSKLFLFWLKKNCFTLPLIVCLFLSEDSASGFNSTHFYWLLAHFPNAVTHN